MEYEQDIFHCPSCGDEVAPMDRLYLHDGRWICEHEMREVIGLKDFPVGAEYTMADICDALGIRDRPAAVVIEEQAKAFHGEGELDDEQYI